ncbi:MAG: DoxX family membrane protein, partial [Flavobacteriales bacterium]
MEQFEFYLPALAIAFARILLGVLLLYQGIDKVFGLGIKRVSETYRQELNKAWIPSWVFHITAYYSSWVELIGGGLLILGLFKVVVLPLIAFNFLLVAMAMSTMSPLWDMRYLFPRVVLLLL